MRYFVEVEAFDYEEDNIGDISDALYGCWEGWFPATDDEIDNGDYFPIRGEGEIDDPDAFARKVAESVIKANGRACQVNVTTTPLGEAKTNIFCEE
jgi:hypothetical protein